MRPAETLVSAPAARRLVLCGGLGAGALALSSLAAFAEGHALMINVSPSLPYWALWVTRGATVHRGDIVLFDPPASNLLTRHFGAAPKPFGKRASGMPGDIVTERGRTFFINGHAIATAKPASRLDEPLALGPAGRVPRGCYFVTTAHPDGFDSRYAAIGWICQPRILGVGRPIL